MKASECSGGCFHSDLLFLLPTHYYSEVLDSFITGLYGDDLLACTILMLHHISMMIMIRVGLMRLIHTPEDK
jgi:hypothetical protein